MLWPASLPPHPVSLILEICLFLGGGWLLGRRHPRPLARRGHAGLSLFAGTQSQSRPHLASLHINSMKTSSSHALKRKTLEAPVAGRWRGLPEIAAPPCGLHHL